MRLIRFIKHTFYTAVILYIAAFGIIWFARITLIYPFNSTYVTPIEAGEPRLDEYQLSTPDNQTLIIWTHPAKERKATIVYFHGNAGNLAGRAQRFSRLINNGYGIVAMAYRGSSGSTGQPSELAISRDALLVRDNLAQMLGQPPKGKIIYYGESLGTGVATKLATTIPPDALILEAPYTSILNIAASQMPIFPIRNLLDQRWETNRYIKTVNSPTLVLHGTHDRIVPYAMGKTIFSLSPAKDKVLKTLKGGGHASAFSSEGQSALYRFIEGL
jgi:pimeloyl-ACP methyl ester carboxylesterase